MKKSVKVACVLALCVISARGAFAQVRVGENVNVLPVYKSTPPGQAPGPDDYLRGDLFGQRQNEPSVAVSTVNKDHILAFYNDFRAVDLGASEPPLPGTTASLLARLLDRAKALLARLSGRPARAHAAAEPEHSAASEAWIGMSTSYDGGLTWVGGLVPGGPEDDSPASLASPAHGLQGASDPVVISAPCGKFFLAWLAFTRGGESRLLVSRFTDLNDSDQRHTIRYDGTTVVEVGMNATNGHFLDKPHAAIELTGGGTCGDFVVHVSYTTFVGKGGNKFTSKITVASSTDGGLTFIPAKVDDSYTQSQGTALVAHPTNRTLYVFWRSFNPNTIVMSRRSSTGTWSKPADILAGQAPMVPFDQPMLGAPTYAFRSNGFPAAAITPDGNSILVAWQELWSDGLPRVVVQQIAPGTGTGPARTPAALSRAASPPGLGFFSPTSSASGPQVMPSISCSVGPRCLLTYFEGRGGLAGGWIAGYTRVLDLRGVVVTPGPLFTSSFQLTRYGYEPPTALNGQVNQPVIDWLAAAIGGGLEGTPSVNASQICPPGQSCYASLAYSGYPHTGGGTVPFMGDYNDVQPVVPYVYKAGKWQVPTLASDVPYDAAFVATWADNRNVVRPADGNWSNYAPPGTGGTSCQNPGSRDQSVMTAQLSSGLLVTAPTNVKPVPAGTLVSFPVTVWNSTASDATFSVKLTGNVTASFAKDPPASNEYAFPLQDGELRIFAYSSGSIYVYVTDPAPFTVTATGSGLSGAMTFNAPGAANGGTYANQATGVTVAENPVPKNPVPKNPVPKNPVPKNPVPKNYTPADGSTTYTDIYGVKDYSVTVSADDALPGDVGAYLSLFNIDKAYKDSYVFQVLITKPTYAFEVVDGCESQNRALGTLVANISDPENPVPKNPVPKNPVPKNPVPKNATPSDALLQNSTFTLGSSQTGTSGFSAASASAPACAADGSGLIAECTKAATRDPSQVIVTLRAYQVKATPTRIFDPYGETTAATPPSVFVADSSCTDTTDPNCVFVKVGPDLAVPDPPTAVVSPTTVARGYPVTFPSQTVPVTNLGTREPTAPYKIGFYLSTATTIAGLPRNADGTIQTGGTTYAQLLETVAASGTQSVDPASLTIPADTPLGTYYLYAYVDSERVISELDEDNNIVQGGPIAITRATPTVTVSGGVFPYDGTAHAATATAKGIGGATVTGSFSFAYSPGGSSAPVNVGQYSVTATFTSSDPNYGSAIGAGSIAVSQATPVVTVSGGVFPYDGTAHAATAAARGIGGATVTGSFSFAYGPGGSSTPVNVGQYSVTATFTSSDPNYGSAIGAGSIVVSQATPVVTVSGGVFPYDGTAHAATAAARGIGGATVPGSFSFAYSPGGSSAPVNVGQYSVTATFTSSDPNYGPASGTGSITVSQASTATTVTSSANPSLLAKTVTLTAKVTAVAPGAGLPTGTVTFKDGTTILGTGALASVGGTATATFTTSSLSAGSHPITATYGGDASFLTSTSAALTQIVGYVFTGFQTPLTTAGTLQSPTISGSWSFSRVLPLKWQLTDGNGANVTSLTSTTSLTATFAGATCPGALTAPTATLYTPTQGAAGGSTFRSGSSGFIFNWDASKNATTGCWWIRLKLADGSPEKVTAVQLQ